MFLKVSSRQHSFQSKVKKTKLVWSCSGAYLDIRNKTANTALHLAAYRGNIDIVKLLVQRGANVFLRNDKGRCASEEAETGNHTLTAQFLYKKMKGTKRENLRRRCLCKIYNMYFLHYYHRYLIQMCFFCKLEILTQNRSAIT